MLAKSFVYSQNGGLFTCLCFRNIDCGKPKDYQKTVVTGLSYISDFDLITTGEIRTDSKFLSDTLFYDTRVFPTGIRNCYSLPVNQTKKYLVRAYFNYGNYDGKNQPPVFDLYLGTTLWSSVNCTTWEYIEKEIIVVASSNWMFVCLVDTGSGTPLITALELRPLPDNLYMQANSTQYLKVIDRWDVGGDKAPVRYPNDEFDRKWPFLTIWSTDNQITMRKGSDPENILNSQSSLNYEPPREVMITANLPENGTTLNIYTDSDLVTQAQHLYVAMHFAEIEQNASRSIYINQSGQFWSGDFPLEYMETNSIYGKASILDGQLDFSIVQDSGSDEPPILNAVEVFDLIDVTEPETYNEDVNAIMDIKNHYNITQENWMGDPCVPDDFLWKGLMCRHDGEGQNKSFRIISLNLSSSGLIGDIYTAICNLSELQKLDLSGNKLTGEIPDLLPSLGQLVYLDLSRNNLSGSVPEALRDKVAAGKLHLGTEGNPYLSTYANSTDDSEAGGSTGTKRILIIAIVISSVLVASIIILIVVCYWRTNGKNESNADTASPNHILPQLKLFQAGPRSGESPALTPEHYPGRTQPRDSQASSSGSRNKIQKVNAEEESNAETIIYGAQPPSHALIVEELGKDKGPRIFSYSDLVNATANFSEARKLGSGGFGDVYMGFLQDLNLNVAIKKFSKDSKQGLKEYLSEVTIISQLRHKNLVQLIGWCHEDTHLLLVYELMPNGSLDCHLFGKNNTILSWQRRYNIALGLASALLYLHNEWKQCVVHRDVKSSNIMLDFDFNALLGDFGIARLVEHGSKMHTTIAAGTLGYMAPECVLTCKASKESDVYSFGIVLLEIASGRQATVLVEESIKHKLVDWVWSLYEEGRVLEAADPRMGGEFDGEQMERLIVVGLWCASPYVSARPSITQAIAALNFDDPMPRLPRKIPLPVSYAVQAMPNTGATSSSCSLGGQTGSGLNSGMSSGRSNTQYWS